MSDFAYDSEDVSAIRVATTDLQRNQNDGLIIFGTSFLIATGLQFLLRGNATLSLWNFRPTLTVGAMLGVSALGYGLYTYRSRARLDRAASLINRKYSYIISSTLNYQKWSDGEQINLFPILNISVCEGACFVSSVSISTKITYLINQMFKHLFDRALIQFWIFIFKLMKVLNIHNIFSS